MAAAGGQFPLSKSDWNPETDPAFQELKPGRRHADNLMLLAIEQQISSEDVAFSAVPLLPQFVAEHAHLVRVGLVFFGQKRSAERELDPEHREEIGCHRIGVNPLWLTVAGQVETPRRKRRHLLEGLALRLPVGVIRRRWRVLREPRE